MKVLVTGASGQVGCRLVRQLLENNYEVRAVVLPDDPNKQRLDGLEIEIVEGNLLDISFCEKVIDKVPYIYILQILLVP